MQDSNRRRVGISDIRVYLPRPVIDLEELVRKRVAEHPRLARHMARALATTGQKSIRFPETWEDTATMAAQAAYELLLANPGLDRAAIRHLAAGTETTVDHSKPVSAYVQGMLQRAGVALPDSLSSFQVQHACAGATMALLSVASMLQSSYLPGESGLVVASDIARYDTESTAEITQGAGAVAMLVESAPKLIDLDLSTVGYFSRDVDDFFRPLGSKTAKVKGRYSMDCYLESLEGAFLDHCRRAGQSPQQALTDTALVMLHTPFRNMPESAMQYLLQRHLGFTNGHTEGYLRDRGFYQGVDPLSYIGNTYAGSLYLALAFLLYHRFQVLGERIVGKRVLLASYGSGNTMIIQAGQVMPQAPEVLSAWNLDRTLDANRPASIEEYDLWMDGPYEAADYDRLNQGRQVPAGSFYLAGIREDGYREYRHAVELHNWLPEGEASSNLHRSRPVHS
jgi:hydroxymethylglutaryl-CoA synthase